MRTRILGRGTRADGRPARTVASATAAYSLAVTAVPKLLAKPTGLLDADGGVPREVSALIRSIGTRDAALAAALALAPAGYPIRLLTAARVICDVADAVWFATAITDRTARAKVSGAAVGWAVLEAVVGWRGSR